MDHIEAELNDALDEMLIKPEDAIVRYLDQLIEGEPSITERKDFSEERLKKCCNALRASMSLTPMIRRIYRNYARDGMNPREAELSVAVVSGGETVCSILPPTVNNMSAKISTISSIVGHNIDWLLQKMDENKASHNCCRNFMLYYCSSDSGPIFAQSDGQLYLASVICTIPACIELMTIAKNATNYCGSMLFVLIDHDTDQPIVFPPWSSETQRKNVDAVDIDGIGDSFDQQVSQCKSLGAESTATIMHISQGAISMATFGVKWQSADDGWKFAEYSVSMTSQMVSYTHELSLSSEQN